MFKLPKLILAGVGSALLLASAVSGASAESRHGAMPSRQMYMHHRMHRPMMHMHPMMRHHYMHRHYMHRRMMRHAM